MAGAKKPTRARKTKTEVQEEFEKIREDAFELAESINSKESELEKAKQEQILLDVSEVSMEGVVSNLAALGIDVNKTLSDLSSKLVTQVDTLKKVRQAIEIERDELKRLHKIDILQTSIDFLIKEYEEKKIALDKEISELQLAWEKEKFERDLSLKDFEESLKKQRAREKEEFEYNKALERKKSEEKYQEDQRAIIRANLEKQEQLEKNWQGREKILKENESEFEKLKAEVATFDDKLKANIQSSVEITKKDIEVFYKNKILVLEKEFEAEKRVSALSIKNLTDVVERQFAQIESLQIRLEEAKKQVQDIAIKAIDGASGARALQHVNQIAMEQAKPRSPTT